MATYKGVAGIEQLHKKIDKMHRTLVSLAIQNIAIIIIENSPLGVEDYAPNFKNDQPGQFKNSWTFGYTQRSEIRGGTSDASFAGTDSWRDAENTAKAYNYQDNAYIVNGTPQAKYIEFMGWNQSEQPIREEYGWKDKPAYEPVVGSIDEIKAALKQVIAEAKKVTN